MVSRSVEQAFYRPPERALARSAGPDNSKANAGAFLPIPEFVPDPSIGDWRRDFERSSLAPFGERSCQISTVLRLAE
jgi:hypothetical protein